MKIEITLNADGSIHVSDATNLSLWCQRHGKGLRVSLIDADGTDKPIIIGGPQDDMPDFASLKYGPVKFDDFAPVTEPEKTDPHKPDAGKSLLDSLDRCIAVAEKHWPKSSTMIMSPTTEFWMKAAYAEPIVIDHSENTGESQQRSL